MPRFPGYLPNLETLLYGHASTFLVQALKNHIFNIRKLSFKDMFSHFLGSKKSVALAGQKHYYNAYSPIEIVLE